MAKMMARGMAWLNRQMENAAGVEITYTRGEVSASGITAWVGRTLFSRQGFGTPGNNSAAVEWGERDYLIPVESLVLNGEATKPRRGDRITEVINGVPAVFEASTPTGEPAWRYSDESETRYRIHCKRVA